MSDPSARRLLGPVDARARTDLPALLADLLAVLVFVLVGRTSHHEGGAVTGTAATAWPFVTGALVGWAVVLAGRATGRPLPPRSMPAGVLVLAGTVVVGMSLRRLFTDGGTPISFLLVATVFLALFLLGWRAVARRR